MRMDQVLVTADVFVHENFATNFYVDECKHGNFMIKLLNKFCYCGHIMLFFVNSVAFRPQANYTYRTTAACWRSYCQLLRIAGVAWSAQRIPPGH
jgi:hypothetical protein